MRRLWDVVRSLRTLPAEEASAGLMHLVPSGLTAEEEQAWVSAQSPSV